MDTPPSAASGVTATPEEEAAQTVVVALALPALMIAPDERISAINEKGVALLGKQAGRHYISSLRQPDLLEAIERCAATKAPQKTNYLSQQGGQDATYIANASWFDLPPAKGVLVSFEDVSHLEHAGQMRRDFVANVSHELRTPLTSLMGFIETLRGPARDDSEARARFLDIMQREAERMERLVKDLLSLNRVESEERVRPTSEVDLAALCRSVVHTMTPLADSAGVTLVKDLPESLVAPADEDQLRQVLTNLIENAVKYGGSGGEVVLRLQGSPREAAMRGPAAILSVSDKGPGIPLVHIPRLTERFYRVDSHRSRVVGGTGLGLAIVKHIINRHRGRLKIESTQGQGTCFTVILPLSV
ncbi:sensor histidine kinase [Rhodalgimonas zhirmunskyi]|uniref:histidine kinase n=1 Tax=Rhodalgimonas zhirmunskyi TaxID=2964767 RepID=A0AAJ1X2Y4_9RHOB|nr:ATP-binding protein [Rhodoalgimonas zhirmunskyi]MDQ2092783.1 ATP-binding protein [Rhodoalgimonas zhirmunskyi]